MLFRSECLEGNSVRLELNSQSSNQVAEVEQTARWFQRDDLLARIGKLAFNVAVYFVAGEKSKDIL